MNKEYNFNEILKEYNKKYKKKFKLDKKISNAIIVYSPEDDTFNVRYNYNDGFHPPVSHTKSLGDLLYYYVSNNLSFSNIKEFILHKDECNLGLKIKILPPNKIRYAYLHTNYYAPGIGNLGKSCMRLKEMQKALNFYTKNKIKIVVVIDSNNKIHARALLWDNVRSIKLKKSFTYLDRIYARSATLLSLFYDLAIANNWERYSSTTVNNMDKNYYKEGIDAAGMCHLPYNDTFRYLYPESNLLTASMTSSILKHLKPSSLCVTLHVHNNNAYYPELDPDRVQEALSSNYISKKDATFIKRYDGYVLKKNIADINGDYYSILDNKIVKTAADGYILKENSVVEVLTNDTIDKNKATKSSKYKGYIHESNIVHIRDEVYHKLDTNITCFDNKWYHISQCFRNFNRNEVNKELAKQVNFYYTDLHKNFVPYAFITSEGDLIPKERAVIAYNLVYNPIFDSIEYQEVFCTNKTGFIQLVTGELIINSPDNKQYLKKFNNKWYIKQDFEAPNKKQLTFNFKE